jgi:hypothetical protein
LSWILGNLTLNPSRSGKGNRIQSGFIFHTQDAASSERILVFADGKAGVTNSQKIEEVVARLESTTIATRSASKSRQEEFDYRNGPLEAPAAPAYRRASVAARPVMHAGQDVILQLRAPFERRDLFAWCRTRVAPALARAPCRVDIGQLV